MTANDNAILSIFAKIIPKLSEQDKEKLLAFGEGLGFKVGLKIPEEKQAKQEVKE